MSTKLSGLALAAMAAISLGVPSVASAVILTFDPLTGNSRGPYTESGYTFTMSGGSIPHFGDGGGPNRTLSWHDGGANARGVIVRLTQTNRNPFDLIGFDIASISGDLLVNGIRFNSTGSKTVNLRDVSSVSWDVGNSVAIDNVNVGYAVPVPEPGTLALTSLALLGLGLRRRFG